MVLGFGMFVVNRGCPLKGVSVFGAMIRFDHHHHHQRDLWMDFHLRFENLGCVPAGTYVQEKIGSVLCIRLKN